MAPPPVDEQTVSMRQKLFALIALSSTGTLVGIFSKVSQVSGKYHFSPASAVVCTEFFKLIISLIMIVRLLLRGELVDRKSPPLTNATKGGIAAKPSPALSGHRTEKEDNVLAVSTKNDDDEERTKNNVEAELGEVGDSKTLLDTESKSHTKDNVDALAGRGKKRGGGGVYAQYKADFVEFWRVNFSFPLVCHQFGLAAAYCVVNIVTYAIFIHASGSMFFLLKASSPVVTAVLLWAMVNRRISRPQWIAVILQCFGLLGTQLNPCAAALAAGGGGVASSSAAAAMSVTGYVLILINVVVSCAAGVWNEHIIKNFGTSVNFQNSLLYTFGVMINLLLFWFAPPRMVGASTDSQMGFFEGYNLSVFGIIMANGSVGLVITMVYKYADVVVKTFGLAGSTITLFLLEIMGLIPGGRVMPLSTSLTGAAAVFYASYIYILPPKEFAPLTTSSEKKVASSSTVVVGGAATGGTAVAAEEGVTKTVVKNTSSFLNNGGGDEGEAGVVSGAALLTASTTSMPDEAPAAFDVMTLSWRSSLAHKKIKTLLAIGASVIFAFISAAMACSLGMN